MPDISQIDSNFAVQVNFPTDNLTMHRLPEEPFRIYGLLPKTEEGWLRLPSEVAKNVSSEVFYLRRHTAGGRLRFRTDSQHIALFATMPGVSKMSHMPLTNSAGFDIYRDNEFDLCFVPPKDITEGYASLRRYSSKKWREITIHFPSYSVLTDLVIGLDKDAQIEAARPYRFDKPVVFYGSSITQGSSASHPGNTYEAIISRRLWVDYVNLGFSGNARGEQAIAEYIASLPMSAFVYDYDYNAITPADLEKTHKRMFDIIREKNPTLPIIMMTRPKFKLETDTAVRRDIVRATYDAARAAGDRNVYYIDGHQMMRDLVGDGGTVDSTHPNDLGFAVMAQVVGGVLKTALGIDH